MIEVTHRFKFAVPSTGAPIWSDADFDEAQEGLEMMAKLISDGQITDWEYWKITKTITDDLVQEGHA